jgi:protein-L-isoaspartate(D-aspartate) O-methyltransferase
LQHAQPEVSLMVDEEAVRRRTWMVEHQLAARDISDRRVLEAMQRVPRHEFVPSATLEEAYADRPLPIGHGVTISQPYIVALMTQALEVGDDDHVLEIGTGSGYGAAVLAELARQVVTVETISPLAASARRRLEAYGERVTVVSGDGSLGVADRAPFDAISVTAAAPDIPAPLLDQLAVGGRLVMPVGAGVERLVLLRRTAAGDERQYLTSVRFVPLTGEHGA